MLWSSANLSNWLVISLLVIQYSDFNPQNSKNRYINLIYVHEHANSSEEIVLIIQELEYVIKKKCVEGI